jgi:hypothetical protein
MQLAVFLALSSFFLDQPYAFWTRAVGSGLFVASIVIWYCSSDWSQQEDEEEAEDDALVPTPLDGVVEDLQSDPAGGEADALPSTQAESPIDRPAAVAQAVVTRDHDPSRTDAIGVTMPAELAAAARSQDHAIPLVLALLLDDKPAVRDKQEMRVREFLGEATLTDANALAPQVAQLHPVLRLPLAELAFPTLRRRPRTELTPLIACVGAMARADGEVSLFEYCLGCMLHQQLTQSLDPSASWSAERKKPFDLQNEIALLLSVIAQNGQGSAADAQRAYDAGMRRILPDTAVAYAPPFDGVGALDKAWTALDELDGIGKSLLVEGLVATIGVDGKTTVAESELLRIICALLHCPLPTTPDRT